MNLNASLPFSITYL